MATVEHGKANPKIDSDFDTEENGWDSEASPVAGIALEGPNPAIWLPPVDDDKFKLQDYTDVKPADDR